MPPVAVGAVAIGGGAALSASAAALATAYISAATIAAIGTSLIGLGMSYALSSLMAPNAKGLGSRSLTINPMESNPTKTMVYGRARVTGPILLLCVGDGLSVDGQLIPLPGAAGVYWETTQNRNNRYLYMAVEIARHQIQQVVGVVINETLVYTDQLAEDGRVMSGVMQNRERDERVPNEERVVPTVMPFVKMRFLLGTTEQSDSAWMSEAGAPDGARGRGVALALCRFKDNPESRFPDRPTVSVIVDGKPVYDPVSGFTYASINPIWQLRDWLLTPEDDGGLGVDADFINEANFAWAAGVCAAPSTAVYDAPTTIVAITTPDDLIELNSTVCPFNLGDTVRFSGGTLPGGISAGVDYFVIPVRHLKVTPDNGLFAIPQDQGQHGTMKVASSLVNAQRGIAVNITSNGSGTRTITRTAEPRYTSGAVLPADMQKQDVLEAFAATIGGAISFFDGTFQVFPGVETTPVAALTEDDVLLSQFSISTSSQGRRDLFNVAEGKCVTQGKNFMPSPYTTFEIADLIEEDGQKLVSEIDLPFTPSTSMARRLLKIAMLRNRAAIALTTTFTMAAWPARPGTTVTLDLPSLGLATLTLLVTGQSIVFSEDFGIGVQLSLVQNNPEFFDPDVAFADALDIAGGEGVVPPTVLAAVANLAVIEVLDVSTGRAQVAALVTWDAHENAIVDRYLVDWRVAGDELWTPGGETRNLEQVVIVGASGSFEFSVRGISRLGLRTPRSTVGPILLQGDITAPAPIESLSMAPVDQSLRLTWPRAVALSVRFGGLVQLRFSTNPEAALTDTVVIAEIDGAATDAVVAASIGVYYALAVNAFGVEALTAPAFHNLNTTVIGLTPAMSAYIAAPGFVDEIISGWVREASALRLNPIETSEAPTVITAQTTIPGSGGGSIQLYNPLAHACLLIALDLPDAAAVVTAAGIAATRIDAVGTNLNVYLAEGLPVGEISVVATPAPRGMAAVLFTGGEVAIASETVTGSGSSLSTTFTTGPLLLAFARLLNHTGFVPDVDFTTLARVNRAAADAINLRASVVGQASVLIDNSNPTLAILTQELLVDCPSAGYRAYAVLGANQLMNDGTDLYGVTFDGVAMTQIFGGATSAFKVFRLDSTPAAGTVPVELQVDLAGATLPTALWLAVVVMSGATGVTTTFYEAAAGDLLSPTLSFTPSGSQRALVASGLLEIGASLPSYDPDYLPLQQASWVDAFGTATYALHHGVSQGFGLGWVTAGADRAGAALLLIAGATTAASGQPSQDLLVQSNTTGQTGWQLTWSGSTIGESAVIRVSNRLIAAGTSGEYRSPIFDFGSEVSRRVETSVVPAVLDLGSLIDERSLDIDSWGYFDGEPAANAVAAAVEFRQSATDPYTGGLDDVASLDLITDFDLWVGLEEENFTAWQPLTVADITTRYLQARLTGVVVDPAYALLIEQFTLTFSEPSGN